MGGYMKTAKSEEWETPQKLFDRLNEIFHFEVDMACTPENKKCKIGIYKESIAGVILEANVYNDVFWCNPPYSIDNKSCIEEWVEKCWKIGVFARANKTVVMLIPSSTEMVAWHKYIWPFARYIIFLKGRLKFEIDGNPQGSAPKGSALVVFTNRDYDLTPLEDLGVIFSKCRTITFTEL
jgi:site-specific DNA-methyltransferase (adenine-specific)